MMLYPIFLASTIPIIKEILLDEMINNWGSKSKEKAQDGSVERERKRRKK